MSVTLSAQQSDWNSNFYVITVTRILLGVGVFYLLRSIVQLVQWSCSPVPGRPMNSVRDGDTAMQMEDLAFDALDAVDTAANPVEMLGLQFPPPSFNLRNILHRTRALSTPIPEPGSLTVLVSDLEAQTHGGTALGQNHAEGNTRSSG